MTIDRKLAIEAARLHDRGKTPKEIAEQQKIEKPVAIRRIVRGYELLRKKKARALERIKAKVKDILKDVNDL